MASKVLENLFKKPNLIQRALKPGQSVTPKFWEQADFYDTLNQSRQDRGDPPVYEPQVKMGDRLFYDPTFKSVTTRSSGQPLFWDQSTNQYSLKSTGVPAVYKGETNYQIGDQPATFTKNQPTVSKEVKAGDKLYYNPQVGEITNVATQYPVYERVGKDGVSEWSLEGDQQALYRNIVEKKEEPDAVYTPGLTGAPTPQTVDKYGSAGLNYFKTVWNPRNGLWQNAVDNFELSTEKLKRMGFYLSEGSNATMGFLSGVAQGPGLDLARGIWSGLAGVGQWLGTKGAIKIGSGNLSEEQQNLLAAQGVAGIQAMTPGKRAALIELEKVKRLQNPDSMSGGDEALVPVKKGTTDRIANRDLRESLDSDSVEWLDQADYRRERMENTFDQSRQYFESFGKQISGEQEDRTVTLARQYGIAIPEGKSYMERRQVPIELRQKLYEKSQEIRGRAYQEVGTNPVQAIESLKESIQLERSAGGKSGVFDPYFAFTWVSNPDAEDKYLSSVAQMELTLGRPLSRYEMWKARDAFVDPWQEGIGETIFDFTNLISLPVIDDIIPAVFKGIKTMGAKTLNGIIKAPVVGQFVEYIGGRAVRSQATRYASDMTDILMGVAESTRNRSGNRFELFQGNLEKIGKAIESGLPAEVNIVRELGLPSTIAGRQERVLLGLSNAFEGTLKVADNQVELKDAIRKGLRPGEWTMLADDARKELRGKFYKVERPKIEKNFQLPDRDVKWQQFYDAQLAKTNDVDARFFADEEIRKLEEAGIEKAAGDAADKLVERNLEQIVPIMSSRFREGYLQVNRPVKQSLLGKMADSFLSTWTKFVLSARPAWVVNNYLDNSFRYLVHGGNPFQVIDVLRADTIQKLLSEGLLPSRMMYTFARAELERGGETVVQVLARGGSFGKTSTALDFFTHAAEQSIEKRSQELDKLLIEKPAGAITNFLRRIKSGAGVFSDSLTDGVSDWNAAIEAAFSVRMFDDTFQKNMTKLNGWGRGQLEEMLRVKGASDSAVRFALQSWDALATNPDQLRAMLKSMRAGSGDVIGYMIPSRELSEAMEGVTPELRDQFISDVSDKLLRAMENSRLNNEVFEPGKFFDDLIKDFDGKKPAILNTPDLRDPPDMQNVANKLDGAPDPAPTPNSEPKVAAPSLPEVVKPMQRATSDLAGQKDGRRLVADLRDAMGENGTIVLKENVPGKYAVAYADGKVTIELDASVLRRKVSQVRTTMIDAMTDAMAVIDREWAEGIPFMAGRDLRKDLSVFLANPGQLRQEAPQVFDVIQKRFDNNTQRRNMMAGLQGRDRLRYHQFANYERAGIGAELEVGIDEADIKQYAPEDFYINGDYRRQMSNKVADAREKYEGTAIGNHLSRMQNTLDRVSSYLDSWMRIYYPGPLNLRKDNPARGEMWEKYFQIKTTVYRRYGEYMERNLSLIEEMGDAAPFDQSLSQILSQLGFGFQFTKDGKKLRTIAWFDETGRAERKISVAFYAKDAFLQQFFGKNVVNMENLRDLVMSAPYRGVDTVWNPKQFERVAEEITEDVVGEVAEDVMKVAPIKLDDAQRQVVKDKLGFELDETGTMKLEDRRQNTLLRNALNKAMRGETLAADEAMELGKLAAQSSTTGLRNKAYYWLIHHGSEFARPTKTMIDVDYLKFFNDFGGHPQGDVILQTFANDLKDIVGNEHVFHLSGDEFFADFDTPEQAEEIMQQVYNKFREHDFIFREVIDGKPTGQEIVAKGDFKWGTAADEFEADQKLIAKKAADRKIRGAEPSGISRRTASAGVEGIPSGTPPAAGRKYVPLTDEDWAKITEVVTTVDPVQTARNTYSQNITKIKDPQAVALIQAEAQEMMDDIFDLDVWDGRPLGDEDFVEYIGKTEWGADLVEVLKKQKNPRTALIEAFEQVISGKGSASNLTKNLRQQIVKNLETGLGNRPAHPYMRKLLGLPEDEAIAKSWSDLGRNPMRELEQMVDTRQNEQALWDAFSQQEWYDGRSLKSAWGNNARNPEVFAAHLRDLIKNLPDGVQDSSIEALQMLLFQVQNYKALRNNFNGLFGTRRSWRLGKNSHVPLSKTIGSMPDNYQQWFLNAEEAAQTVDGIDAGLRKWKDYAKNKPDLGLQEADLDALEVSAEEIARLKQSLLNMAAFGPDEKNLETLLRDSFGWVTRQKDNVWQRRVGNEWQNLSKKEMGMFQRVQNVLTEQANILKGAGDVEGALQRTNRFMIDYGDFSRLDEMMRYVVPFWKFTSRSFPFWIETLATHPQILAAYGKYINFTRRVQMQEGIRTSTGEQMPSLEGYLPIPGTDMWFNPLAPLSFRYVIPKYRNYGDENENMPIMGQVFNWLQDYSQVFGVGLNPMFVAPWKIMGHLDNKPTSALVPQINLMPPWYLNSIRGYVNKIGGPVAQDAAEVILGSELPWMDYMVERRLLANLSEEIRRDPARATELVAKMELAIREREGSELWNETRREMENSDLARNWAGYFTAMYAKEFTDAEVDFQHLRDDLNFHRSMVNDQIGAEVFGLDPDVVNRYEHYTHTAYETPEGAQVNLYNNLRWVQSPTGEELQGQERRDAVVAKLDQQEVTAKYHEALEHNYEWYQSQLKALPVGADSKLRQKLYQQFIQYRDEIEGSELYDTATRGWAMGYKPEELVYEHFQSLWWQIVEETKPQYDGEDYNAYQLQVAQWTSDLPYIATTLASAAGLNQMLTTQLKVEELPEGMPMAGGRELNVQNLVQKLIAETTPELYEQWSKGKDTPMRAMDKAWQELYWNKYWDTMRDLSGYERELVEQNFILNFPKPSTEMMVNWVMQNYPGQFDPKMLQDAVQDRKVESVASRLAPKDPQATMEQDVWDTLSMAGPNKDALQKAYEQMGGYWASDISGLWYGSGGSSSAWSDPEKFQMFHDRLMEAAASLGLQEPDALTLKEWAQAQDLDAKRKAFLDEKLGADYMDNMRAYWAADKRTRYEMRKADPTIDEYYRIQDGWEEQYPIWAKYYTEQESTSTKTSTGSGGGGGGYTRRSYSSGGGSGSSYVPASYTLGMGARSTLDASRLPGSLGKAKPGGSIRIPAALQGIIGEAATAEIESGEPISQKTQDFLKKVEKRHPEHKEIIRTIIGGKPVSGNVLKEMQ